MLQTSTHTKWTACPECWKRNETCVNWIHLHRLLPCRRKWDHLESSIYIIEEIQECYILNLQNTHWWWTYVCYVSLASCCCCTASPSHRKTVEPHEKYQAWSHARLVFYPDFCKLKYTLKWLLIRISQHSDNFHQQHYVLLYKRQHISVQHLLSRQMAVHSSELFELKWSGVKRRCTLWTLLHLSHR